MDQQTLDVMTKMLTARKDVAAKYGNRAEVEMLLAELDVLDAVKIPKKSSVASRR